MTSEMTSSINYFIENSSTIKSVSLDVEVVTPMFDLDPLLEVFLSLSTFNYKVTIMCRGVVNKHLIHPGNALITQYQKHIYIYIRTYFSFV